MLINYKEGEYSCKVEYNAIWQTGHPGKRKYKTGILRHAVLVQKDDRRSVRGQGSGACQDPFAALALPAVNAGMDGYDLFLSVKKSSCDVCMQYYAENTFITGPSCHSVKTHTSSLHYAQCRLVNVHYTFFLSMANIFRVFMHFVIF